MISNKSLAWVLLHLIAIVLISVNILTGLRIATLNHEWLLFFSSLLPQGEVHILHIYSGVLLSCVGITYILFNSLYLSRKSTYSWLILLSLITGILLLNDVDISSLLDMHYLFAFSTFIYIFIHSSRHFILNGINVFKTILIPNTLYKKDNLIILFFLVSISTLSLLLLNNKAEHQLFVKKISTSIIIDGDMNESEWSKAQSLNLHTYGGANFINGESNLVIRALANKDTVFFSFVWSDPTQSINFMPIIKEKKAWRVLESGFYNFNETEYYEDKFALILSNNSKLSASGSVHLGPKPIDNKPENWHSKGYHYTHSKDIIDMWHWKAVRTNSMRLADDEFLSSPHEAYTGERRYSAGILPDSKESGGYRMNWQWYKKDGIVPKRLPLYKDELSYFKDANSTIKPWKANWYDYIAYDNSLDNYKIGTYMPSVIYITNGFEGDRADVMAYATWKNGFWYLEVARKLDTGSQHDVVISNKTYIWAALFDHSQIAHTRHSLPVHLVFGESDD